MKILDHPVQSGKASLSNNGCDIVFEHVDLLQTLGEAVLKDVSFTAKQGGGYGPVGPSGGGKTTVSPHAARFWDVDRGKITIGGMDISKVDPETLLPFIPLYSRM